MVSTECARFIAVTLLVIAACVAPLSFARGQSSGHFGITAQANLSATPMVGVEFSLNDRASARLAAGYFRSSDSYVAYCDPASAIRCPEVAGGLRFSAAVHQMTGGLTGTYRLLEWGRGSAYTGFELQFVHAWAPERVKRQNMGWYGFETSADRFSGSGIAGLSIQLSSRLSLFGEIGMGYVRSPSIHAFRPDLESTIRRWGITHVMPGFRVAL